MEERKILADGSCILGDSAFSEGEWMRTPITLPQERAERFFNCKHSSMRMRVEHAFGRLKWKFLALRRGLLFKLEDAPIVIDACVILYNFILDHEGTWSSHEHIDDAQTKDGTGRAPGENSAGREAEVAYLRDAGFLQEEWGDPGPRADRRCADRERRFRGEEEMPSVDM